MASWFVGKLLSKEISTSSIGQLVKKLTRHI